jgi:TonB family protein
MYRSFLVLAISGMIQLTAADVRGIWSGTYASAADADARRAGIVLTLRQSGQQLSGTVATSDNTIPEPIERVEVRDDVVTFEVHETPNRVVKYRLDLIDGRMTGEISVGDLVFKVELSPAVNAGFYPIAGGDLARTQPALIRQVQPEYTDEARAARVQGTVVLRLEIDPAGKVEHAGIRVVRSLGLGLDEKAIEAVRQWTFKPATKDGVPISAPATIEVNFRL